MLSRDASLRKRFVESAKKSATVFYAWYLNQYFRAAEGTGSVGSKTAEIASPISRSDEDLVGLYRDYLALVGNALGHDASVVFVYVPRAYAVRPADSARWGLHDQRAALDLRSESSRMLARLRDVGMPLLDTTDALVDADHQERMYYLVDTHLTAAGNRVVAAEVAAFIERRLLDRR